MFDGYFRKLIYVILYPLRVPDISLDSDWILPFRLRLLKMDLQNGWIFHLVHLLADGNTGIPATAISKHACGIVSLMMAFPGVLVL